MPLTPRQECVVDALGRVAWATWERAGRGQTFDALEYLDVFRGLYNLEIENLAPGLTPATAAALPTRLDAAQWDPPMARAVAAMAALALIRSDARPSVEAVRSMPSSFAQVGGWFTRTMRPAVSASVASNLGRYVDIRPGDEELLITVSRAVKNDLRACDPAILAPRVTEAQAAASIASVAESPDYAEGVEPSEHNAPSGSNNTLLLAGVAVLAAVLWMRGRS